MNINLSNTSDKPIYEQITSQIKQQIAMGALAQGEMLPSIRALARDLRISVITTKRAYQELELDGFIETVGGKGSFVAVRNEQVFREETLCQVEEKLRIAVTAAKHGGIAVNEVKEILDDIWEEME